MQHSTQAFTETGVMLRAFSCSGGSVSVFYTPARGKFAGFTKRAPHPGDMLDIHAEPMRNGGDLPRVITEHHKACGAVISASGELLRIRALQAVLELIYVTQPDGDPSPMLYRALARFLHGLSESREGVYAFPVFEALLLDASGYRLSPDKCVRYEEEDACYISPRTGAGVGATAGHPYKDRLLSLSPSFRYALLECDQGAGDDALPGVSAPEDMLNACMITGCFLAREFSATTARDIFIAALRRKQPIAA